MTRVCSPKLTHHCTKMVQFAHEKTPDRAASRAGVCQPGFRDSNPQVFAQEQAHGVESHACGVDDVEGSPDTNRPCPAANRVLGVGHFKRAEVGHFFAERRGRLAFRRRGVTRQRLVRRRFTPREAHGSRRRLRLLRELKAGLIIGEERGGSFQGVRNETQGPDLWLPSQGVEMELGAPIWPTATTRSPPRVTAWSVL
jgi:hypothetical protein